MSADLPLRKYAVLRAHPDLPAGFLPSALEGRWYDVTDTDTGAPQDYSAIAVLTDRFERRDGDGATARVYEVRP